MIQNCKMRHENGNCLPAGGFCLANKNICEALQNAYEMGQRNVIENLPSAQKKGKWIIKEIRTFDLAYGTAGYEPVYECSECGMETESYLRLDEPIMPEDADFPRFCQHCGARMEE